jgi:hypothetical protein
VLNLPVTFRKIEVGSDGRTRDVELDEPEVWGNEGELAFNVAWTFMHELRHGQGQRHHQMDNETYKKWAAPFRGEALPMAVAKPAPERDLVAERAAHASKMLAKHQAMLKREQNIVKKWQAKVRYYERKAGAS